MTDLSHDELAGLENAGSPDPRLSPERAEEDDPAQPEDAAGVPSRPPVRDDNGTPEAR